MASLALRPRSPSELVDAAFQIMRAHYAQFVTCSAIAYFPWLIIQLILASDATLASRVDVATGSLLAVGVWLVFALMSAVLILCASQAYLGDPVDVGAAVRAALPRLHIVLAAALVRYLYMGLGFLFFLVGALYVGARFFAITPVIVLENQGVSVAFKRSTFLSDGRKRHVLNTLGLVAIIYWVLAIGIQLLATVAIPNEIVKTVITAAFTIMVYPVVAITEALLYYDTRIKSEGLDIELMAGALEGVPTRAPAST